MNEQEPTVQVPVSLPTRGQIAEALFRVDHGPDAQWGHTPQVHHEYLVYADAMLALLSQPTPTAEPPRIEDLETGTLLELGKRWTVARDPSGATFLYRDNNGYAQWMLASDIDPSTIRHVQQPTNAS